MSACQCQLCETERLSVQLNRRVDKWEVYYGIGSPTAEYVRSNPGLTVWEYDVIKRKFDVLSPKDQKLFQCDLPKDHSGSHLVVEQMDPKERSDGS